MIGALLKRPRTPPNNNPAMDYQTADSEHVLKRSRPFGISDEVHIPSYNFYVELSMSDFIKSKALLI